MTHTRTAILALALACGLGGTASAQSMATPGPAPDSWLNAVPGPTGRSGFGLEPYHGAGSGSSTPPTMNAPLTSPDNPQAPLGAGGISTGGQYFAR